MANSEKKMYGQVRQAMTISVLHFGPHSSTPLSEPLQFELGTPELLACPSMLPQVVVADDYGRGYPQWYLV